MLSEYEIPEYKSYVLTLIYCHTGYCTCFLVIDYGNLKRPWMRFCIRFRVIQLK